MPPPQVVRLAAGRPSAGPRPETARGRIARIVRSATHDGPGVRTVVYLKGCPLRCAWCHSPETQAPAAEVLLYRERCVACGACVETCGTGAAALRDDGPAVDRRVCTACGACVARCPAAARDVLGAPADENAVMEVIRRDVPFYDASGGGVTFSGGEPLLQPTFLAALLARCRAEGIATAIETCGHASRRALLRAAAHGPLFLFDLKLLDDERHRAATGVSNRQIVANLRTLAARGAAIVLRVPLVPGVTDAAGNLDALGRLAASLGIRRVDVLPYHRAGTAKYPRLGREYVLADVCPPATTEAAAAAARLAGFGLDARVEGSA